MIRVLIADDHALFRQGLAELLSGEGSFAVSGMARDGAEALALARALGPGVLILDISMPVMNGFEVARRIRDEGLPVKVLMLSMHKDQASFRQALELGADGYVLKEEAFESLARAIRAVAAGRRFFSPSLTAGLDAPGEGSGPLSPRERQVVLLIASGKTTREIASTLGVSVKTVEAHREHIMRKLGCRKVAQIVLYAVRAGIVE